MKKIVKYQAKNTAQFPLTVRKAEKTQSNLCESYQNTNRLSHFRHGWMDDGRLHTHATTLGNWIFTSATVRRPWHIITIRYSETFFFEFFV